MYEQLIDIVNTNQLVTAHKIESCEMFDFLVWQDQYYRTPEGVGSLVQLMCLKYRVLTLIIVLQC